MKQRLGIARAISTKPELLILDEPINGLDPIGIKELRDLFKMLSKEYGMTIFVSSHILGEMEQMVDTIGVINHGKLLEEISLDSINGRHTEYIEVVVDNSNLASFILEEKVGIKNFKVLNHGLIRIYDSNVTQKEISKSLVLNDISVESINKKSHSLEEYFLKLINGGGIHA